MSGYRHPPPPPPPPHPPQQQQHQQQQRPGFPAPAHLPPSRHFHPPRPPAPGPPFGRYAPPPVVPMHQRPLPPPPPPPPSSAAAASTGDAASFANATVVAAKMISPIAPPTVQTFPVFIGNIPSDVTNAAMVDVFKQCGPLLSFQRTAVKGQLPSYGICNFTDATAALRALRILGGVSIKGSVLQVAVEEKTQESLDAAVDATRSAAEWLAIRGGAKKSEIILGGEGDETALAVINKLLQVKLQEQDAAESAQKPLDQIQWEELEQQRKRRLQQQRDDSNEEDSRAKKQKHDVSPEEGEVVEEEEEEKKEEMKKQEDKVTPPSIAKPLPVSVAASEEDSREDEMYKVKSGVAVPVVEAIPTSRDALYACAIDWTMIDNLGLLEKRVAPWVRAQIERLLGVEDADAISFVLELVKQRKSGHEIETELDMMLGPDAQEMAMGLVRELVAIHRHL